MKTILLLLSLFVCAQVAAATIGTDDVYGENSLYAVDWGHSYASAVGVGDPAEAWQDTPDHAFGFSSGDHLLITASGCVVDWGLSCTGPDNMGGEFRGLPVYSLIGVWSDGADLINPIASPFVVGGLLNTIVPNFGLSTLYLFLATNDGDFDDNYTDNTYSVTIERLSDVPVPAAFWLLASGLLLVGGVRKKSA